MTDVRMCSATACVAVLALLMTGCNVSDPYPPTPSTQAAQALEQLEALPSLEDTKTQVQSAMDEITTAGSKLIPSVELSTPHQGSADNCETPYEQTDGKRYFFPDQVAVAVAVSEADWTAILAAARASRPSLVRPMNRPCRMDRLITVLGFMARPAYS
nr:MULTISPECIES: LppA family lipoprotein [unclassified Mycobacterium]